MIHKLLIANRGEIACRVMRTAKAMHIPTVAVYSDADSNAMHTAMADEAIAIGPAPATQSYLVQDKIIEAAKATGANAIHPGYGFLSENAGFARRCEAEGIIFVGPPASAIDAMGSKSKAKQIMEQAGVPLVPGYHGDNQDEQTLLNAAREIGFPVMLKAAAGGGGKGMRQVMEEADFDAALAAAKREAKASFGDDTMLVEKFLTQPRHVEIQVFCDSHGNGVYLFERDCSVQRRHQKIIEEAPAPGLSDEVRKQMGESALDAAKAIGYVGAGTVEFLLDVDAFYFMEMNTRLQVEHPVTEYITSEDLVAWQLSVAQGNPLPKSQEQLTCHGHAFEVRVYAEDPDNGFLPSTGTLSHLQFPQVSESVRIDTGFQQGDTVSVHYDPMIAKVITWGKDREEARQLMLACLKDTHVVGVSTNIGYVNRVMQHPAFANAELTTHFIPHHEADLTAPAMPDTFLPVMALRLLLSQRSAVHADLSHWRMNHPHKQQLNLECMGKHYALTVTTQPQQFCIDYEGQQWLVNGTWQDGMLQAEVNGYRSQHRMACVDETANQWVLFNGAETRHFAQVHADMGEHDDSHDGGCIAPMNGTIVKLLVDTNTPVKKGTPLLVMEAMKMEHNVTAPADGQVGEFYFSAGDMVDGGASLLEFIADDA